MGGGGREGERERERENERMNISSRLHFSAGSPMQGLIP